MIVIGRSKTVKVRRRDTASPTFKLIPKLGPDGQQETRIIADEVWRETKDVLDGSFGPDRRKKLVGGFVDGDLLVLYVKGTKRKYSATLVDIYRWMIRSAALKVQLEKARNSKKAKEARRRAAAIRRADLRLKRPLV